MQNGLGVYWKIAISSAIAVSDFSPPDSSRTLCSRLPGGDATMSMPDSAMLVSSVSRISPMPPPNSVRNISRKIAVDRLEGIGEPLARFHVDIVNGFLGVANGIEQILPLGVQEIVALLRFLKFFQSLRIHRAPAPRSAPSLPDTSARLR